MIFQPAKYPVMLGKFPNIIGTSNYAEPGDNISSYPQSGAFYNSKALGSNLHWNASSTPLSLAFDASRSSSMYGATKTVQPRSFYTLMIIKV